MNTPLPHNNLTVVTHTRRHNPYPELLERCKLSVSQALPADATHVVLENDLGLADENNRFTKFSNLRFDALKYGKYIAFVDDDDYIHPMSLKLCMDALLETGVGVAVTNEVVVDVDGNELSANRLPRAYCGVAMHPRTIHHLTVINSEFVVPEALAVAIEFGIGIEWAIKASACLHGGGVHIPIDGYYWTQHKTRPSTVNYARQAYEGKILAMSAALKSLLPKRSGILPPVVIAK